MIAPNSLVRQKEGAQGEEEEEREIEKREDRQELRHQARTFPRVQLGQGCRKRRTGDNMDSGVGFYSTRRVERATDQSYPLTIGMEGTTES